MLYRNKLTPFRTNRAMCHLLQGQSLFHPGSGSFPPFPSGNYNPNPTLGNSVNLLFGWNWNANNPLGPQNVSLVFSSLSLQQLGTSPSFGPIGNTNPIGKQLMGGKPHKTMLDLIHIPHNCMGA